VKKKYFVPMLSLVIFVFALGLTRHLAIPVDNEPNEEATYIEENLLVNKDDEHLETELEDKETLAKAKLLAVGDLMFHMPQNRAAYDNGENTYDYAPFFKHVKPYIENADIAIGNFETVTRADREYSGFPRFNTPKETLSAIGDAGFDILSTANNHCLDQGKKGIIDTIDSIHQYSMINIGTYKNRDDNQILVKEINNIKIGFLSYTYGLNGLDSLLTEEELSYMINLIDEGRIKLDIENAREIGTDLVVVSIHWGNEYQRKAHVSQIDLGEKIIDWGGDIVLGSHPHVIQGSQIVERDGKEKFIIYSLGNFISNQRQDTMGNSYTEDGLMVEIEIEKDLIKSETAIKDIHFIPTWVYKYREGNKVNYEILPIEDILEENSSTYTSIIRRLEKSYEDTIEKVTENSLYSELN